MDFITRLHVWGYSIAVNGPTMCAHNASGVSGRIERNIYAGARRVFYLLMTLVSTTKSEMIHA